MSLFTKKLPSYFYTGLKHECTTYLTKIYRYNNDTNPSTQNDVDKKWCRQNVFYHKGWSVITTKTLEAVWRLYCNVADLTTTTLSSIRPTKSTIRMRVRRIGVRFWPSGGNPMRFSGLWSVQQSGWSKWFCQPENKKIDEIKLSTITTRL